VKSASHVTVSRAKSASHANCVSRWMQRLVIAQPLAKKPVLSVRNENRVSRAYRVKSANHVPNRPLWPAMKRR
jgi:hypothetical protein